MPPIGRAPARPSPIIVTRPQPEADLWVERLRAAGWQALALPLLDIQAAGDSSALQRVWESLQERRALMFVSAPAVQHFFAGRPVGASWPDGLRAWCTGPGSRAALLSAGVPAGSVDWPAPDAPQFDSETLWAVVQDQIRLQDRVLLVRGQDAEGEAAGRTWLADRLKEAGAQVETLAVYRRGVPQWSPHQRQMARQALLGQSLWIFSSSQAASHLPQLAGMDGWVPTARALATHARIAEAVRPLGFARVDLCRPDLPSVLGFLESSA